LDAEIRGQHNPAAHTVTVPTVWLRKDKGRSSIALREWQLEWIAIMEFGTLFGVHGDRAIAVV